MTILLEATAVERQRTEPWRTGLTGLFSSWTNTVLTLAAALVIVLCSWHFFRWAVWEAAWSGGPEACKVREGACWPFVVSNARLMFFGVYPEALLWRPAVSLALMSAVIVASMIPVLWGWSLIVAWVATPTLVCGLLAGVLTGDSRVDQCMGRPAAHASCLDDRVCRRLRCRNAACARASLADGRSQNGCHRADRTRPRRAHARRALCEQLHRADDASRRRGEFLRQRRGGAHSIRRILPRGGDSGGPASLADRPDRGGLRAWSRILANNPAHTLAAGAARGDPCAGQPRHRGSLKHASGGGDRNDRFSQRCSRGREPRAGLAGMLHHGLLRCGSGLLCHLLYRLALQPMARALRGLFRTRLTRTHGRSSTQPARRSAGDPSRLRY